MKQINFATKNKGKVASMKATLSKYNIQTVHYPIEIPELRSEDLRKIAEGKVLHAYKKIKKPCIAIDAGFYIHSLNGYPGTYTNHMLEKLPLEKILRMVEGESRACEFRNCLAYYDGKEIKFFKSKVEGTLSDKPYGKLKEHSWSKLFLVFMPKSVNKTLAQMSYKEYKKWREKRLKKKNHFAIKFAEWYSKK